MGYKSPKQLLVMSALVAQVEGINPDNEDPSWDGDDSPMYPYDLRGRVFTGRSEIGQEVEMPAVAFLEAPKPENGLPAGEEKQVRHEDWQVLVQGWAEDDKANPGVPAYLLKARVEARLARIIAVSPRGGSGLYPDEYRLGGLITKLVIGQGVVRPPDKISPKAYFYLPLTIGLRTDSSDPYRT